ncbi:hypothetical protein K227x_45170 [Rubripirellula lacrimiformis]|uniref:Uncharacterized protein n=1 Tax=Rubripirellula lacrimiformis TaxID=1930273 RepID=A0A517NG54_9BACT|nr:hypothetical protein K227x_45170 [Rubripirellula lacrimiformis]
MVRKPGDFRRHLWGCRGGAVFILCRQHRSVGDVTVIAKVPVNRWFEIASRPIKIHAALLVGFRSGGGLCDAFRGWSFGGFLLVGVPGSALVASDSVREEARVRCPIGDPGRAWLPVRRGWKNVFLQPLFALFRPPPADGVWPMPIAQSAVWIGMGRGEMLGSEGPSRSRSAAVINAPSRRP